MTAKPIEPEDLAALIDGKLSEEERRLLLSRLDQDEDALAVLAGAAAYQRSIETGEADETDEPETNVIDWDSYRDAASEDEDRPQTGPSATPPPLRWALPAAAVAALLLLALFLPRLVAPTSDSVDRHTQLGWDSYQAMAAEIAKLDGAPLKRFSPPSEIDAQTLAGSVRLRSDNATEAPENDAVKRLKESAFAAYEKALSDDPGNLAALKGAASIALVSGKPDDLRRALTLLESAPSETRQSRDFRHPRLLLRFALAHRGGDAALVDQTVGEMRALRAEFADHPAIVFNLGAVLWETDQYEEGRKCFQDYLALEPDGPYGEIARERVP